MAVPGADVNLRFCWSLVVDDVSKSVNSCRKFCAEGHQEIAEDSGDQLLAMFRSVRRLPPDMSEKTI